MEDQIYLIGSLAKHRRSRLLMQLLDAVIFEPENKNLSLPVQGICLLFGQEYQQADAEKQKEYQKWCQAPGRTFLLVPPFDIGSLHSIDNSVDWSLVYSNNGVTGKDGSVAAKVAEEAVFCIKSESPVFDRDADHQWEDYTFNTLLNKHHSGSGVFAATALPLWSISLIDFRVQLLDWIELLHNHAGKAINGQDEDLLDTEDDFTLEEKDYSVLACIYAYGTGNAIALTQRMSGQLLPLFVFDKIWLDSSFERIESLNYIKTGKLTKQGLGKLKKCPWWQHAQLMKEEL